MMSCNGCRVLRRGCSDHCVLRSCLDWIDTPQAQGNAILFVSKFFGRSDLLSFVSAVPETRRPALFQSLLFEACGRTVNPVSGAVGLMSTGNWHVCQEAVNTVLAGGALRPISFGNMISQPSSDDEERWERRRSSTSAVRSRASPSSVVENTASFESGITEVTAAELHDGKEPKLLNLFA